MRTTQLLIIDPQNDFCDLPPEDWPHPAPGSAAIAPALPVPGAHQDMQRLARWIDAHSPRISAITTTLDSHQAYDIAHPAFWRQRDGSAVSPFTAITAAQLRHGDFAPRDGAAQARALHYLDALEREGRYTLMVWPLHCEIGSWGHGVHADVLSACRAWQVQQQRAVHHVFKGMNPWTEHYSAIRAEVPDPHDPHTGVNTALLGQLAGADTLVIAGQASSHCVRASTEHIIGCIAGSAQRIVLLTDCMSPVTGFEPVHQHWLSEMRQLGVRCERSTGFVL